MSQPIIEENIGKRFVSFPVRIRQVERRFTDLVNSDSVLLVRCTQRDRRDDSASFRVRLGTNMNSAGGKALEGGR